MRVIVILLILIVLPSLAYTQTTSAWKTIDKELYTVKYPDSWESDLSGQRGTSFILLSPIEALEDKFRENVNLLIQDISGYNLDLDQYTIASEQQIKSMMENSSLIESKRIKLKNSEHQMLRFTGDQPPFHLMFVQYYWIIANNAYVLTFTAEQNKFEKYESVAKEIMDSFVIKK